MEGKEIGKLDYFIEDNNGVAEVESTCSDDDTQIFKLICEDVWDYELRIENNMNETAVIESIEIRRIK